MVVIIAKTHLAIVPMYKGFYLKDRISLFFVCYMIDYNSSAICLSCINAATWDDSDVNFMVLTPLKVVVLVYNFHLPKKNMRHYTQQVLTLAAHLISTLRNNVCPDDTSALQVSGTGR